MLCYMRAVVDPGAGGGDLPPHATNFPLSEYKVSMFASDVAPKIKIKSHVRTPIFETGISHEHNT